MPDEAFFLLGREVERNDGTGLQRGLARDEVQVVVHKILTSHDSPSRKGGPPRIG